MNGRDWAAAQSGRLWVHKDFIHKLAPFAALKRPSRLELRFVAGGANDRGGSIAFCHWGWDREGGRGGCMGGGGGGGGEERRRDLRRFINRTCNGSHVLGIGSVGLAKRYIAMGC